MKARPALFEEEGQGEGEKGEAKQIEVHFPEALA